VPFSHSLHPAPTYRSSPAKVGHGAQLLPFRRARTVGSSAPIPVVCLTTIGRLNPTEVVQKREGV
jgi:hypothetical protein